jgi:hypothetical protein
MSGSTLSTSETVAGSASTKASSACSEAEPPVQELEDVKLSTPTGATADAAAAPRKGEADAEYGADPRCNNLFAIF